MPGKLIALIFMILISVYGVSAQIDAPKLTTVPSTESQQQLIIEGIALHDNQDYDGAIRKYEEVLKENPDSIEAMWELCLSYYTKGDYQKSLDTAYRGARYRSPYLVNFYTSAGNNLDNRGDAKKALEFYEAAIKVAPDDALPHYNMAITFRRIGRREEARKSVKRSVVLDPNRPSSHLVLGDLFYSGGYSTPALLALSRFLILEPKSERASDAYTVVLKLLQAGVTAGDKPGDTIIMMVDSPKKDEGDFGAIDLALGLSRAAGSLEKNKGKTKAQLAVDQLNTFLSILSEIDKKENKSKFVFKYYVSYFFEMKKRNYVEPFYYYISRVSNDPDVEKWLDGNFRRVSEFLSWSKQYEWPQFSD
jgi:Tfp pilus assembly protein PilF